MATSRRWSLAKIRLCIFASIFELLPLACSSERALLLKVRITTQCKQLAYICQERLASEPGWILLQRQFWLAAGTAFGRCRRGRRRGAHKAPADRGSVPPILPDHDLGGAARAVISGQEHAVFQFDRVVERLEGPDVAVRQHQHHAPRVAAPAPLHRRAQMKPQPAVCFRSPGPRAPPPPSTF